MISGAEIPGQTVKSLGSGDNPKHMFQVFEQRIFYGYWEKLRPSDLFRVEK